MTAKRPDPTAAERKRRQRAKEREGGLEEVRGIKAPPVDHPEIKEAALKHASRLAKRRAKTPKE